ncbi:hypothetical protein M405DRAFT_207843 [Rhizopogon salebrosus TDB-379]|nr:hypothetical protein M405DRAFT_207843 [Rhizopogon salebrosus TDB-379]
MTPAERVFIRRFSFRLAMRTTVSIYCQLDNWIESVDAASRHTSFPSDVHLRNISTHAPQALPAPTYISLPPIAPLLLPRNNNPLPQAPLPRIPGLPARPVLLPWDTSRPWYVSPGTEFGTRETASARRTMQVQSRIGIYTIFRGGRVRWCVLDFGGGYLIFCVPVGCWCDAVDICAFSLADTGIRCPT